MRPVRPGASPPPTRHAKPHPAVAISTSNPKRRGKLPGYRPGAGRIRPYSRADAPYFRSSGFFVRVGGLAVLVGAALCILLLRAWSIQVLHGPQYTALANQQSFRSVDLPARAARSSTRRAAHSPGNTGHIVVVADADALGSLGTHGWHATATGSEALRKLAGLSHVRVATLVTRIRRSMVRSPFAPAVVLPHPERDLALYLDERAAAYPGFKVAKQPARSYPQGAFGSEFLGLLGEVSQTELDSPAVQARAGPAQSSASPASRRRTTRF